MPRIITEEWIERERALIQFRNGSVSYLITTDLSHVDWYTRASMWSLSFTFKEDEFTRPETDVQRVWLHQVLPMLRLRKREKMEHLWMQDACFAIDNDNIA
jgi:superfamily II DNA/RNA helicase